MGFGYGRTTDWQDTAYSVETGERVAKVSNQVAHLWNAQTQTFAKSGNGNLAFRGSEIYSYGPDWIVGKLWRDAALINGDKVSLTTSNHENDAWHATSNRPRYLLPELPREFAERLDLLELVGTKARALATLQDKDWIQILRSRCYPAESYGRWSPLPVDAPTLGEFIAAEFGIRKASWLKIEREHAKREAKEKAAAEKRERDAFVAAAIAAADSDKPIPRTADSYKPDLVHEAKELNRYRVKAGLSGARKRRLLARERAIRALLVEFDRVKFITEKRRNERRLIAAIRNAQRAFWEELAAESPRRVSSHSLRSRANDCFMLAEALGIPKLASQANQLRVIAEEVQQIEREEAAATAAERARKREEEAAADLAAWLVGHGPSRIHATREDGTPYLRVRDESLETSWGASVPLAHAVKVFRFVKLCRDRGEDWQRNGRTIRVGHFQVDRVNSDGSFVAGCHRFAWEEVERVARAAGVYDLEASGEALEPSQHAA